MEKKLVLATAFVAVLLFSAVVGAQFVNLASANPIQPRPDLPRIYIRADGSVEPLSAPIQRVDSVYTFTDNIAGYTIEVQRDNIVIDGAGHFIKGSGMAGIILPNRNKVTVKNVELRLFYEGIRLYNSSNNHIIRNKITNNRIGMAMYYCSNNRIERNSITNNNEGIIPHFCDHNSMVKNNITKNGVGIAYFSHSDYDSIIGNDIAENRDGLDTSGATYCCIEGNNIVSNERGINGGSYNNITRNNIINNRECGIHLQGGQGYNNIVENIIANNGLGIDIYSSNDNVFYHNNLINNTKQVIIVRSIYGSKPVNIWDDGTEGNYWSNYNGTDENNDGIGDTPVYIDGDNQDRYPLMEPVVIPQQSESLPITWIAAAIAIIAIGVAITLGVVIYRRKRLPSSKTP